MKIKQSFNKDKLWFTSDLHLGHNNINDFCMRPYRGSKANSFLIDNWNSLIKQDDDVIVAGDFMFTSNLENIREMVNMKLNGRLHLVLGNHCYQNKFDRDSVKEIFEGRVYDVLSINVEDDELESGANRFFISHYPHLAWERGSIHLHGHLHTGPFWSGDEAISFHPYRYDIGVDNNFYKPISYHQVKTIITQQLLQNSKSLV